MKTETLTAKSACVAYYSGTGGAKLVAEAFVSSLNEKGWLAHLHNTRTDPLPENFAQNELVVLVYAVHACNAPKRIYSWIDQLPIADQKPAVIISVSGGGEMFPNTACRTICKKKLAKRGYLTVYEDMFMMPSNFIVNTPEPLAIRLLHEYPQRAGRVVDEVLHGARRELVPKLTDWVITFLGQLELVMAGQLGRLFKIKNACNRCGWCSMHCESKNIEMVGEKPRFLNKCELCMNCVYGCPVGAIKTSLISRAVLKNGFRITSLRKKQAETPNPDISEFINKSVWTGARTYLGLRTKENQSMTRMHSVLRFSAIALILIIIVFTLLLLTFTNSAIPYHIQQAQNGVLTIRSTNVNEVLCSMEGTWEFYPNIYCTESSDIDELREMKKTHVHIPYATFIDANASGTYRLTIKTSGQLREAAFFFPHTGAAVNIFANKNPVGLSEGQARKNGSMPIPLLYTDRIYPFTLSDGFTDLELIISVKNEKGESAFFHESPIFGSSQLLEDHSIGEHTEVVFSIGLIMMFLISGLVFMAIRPSNRFHTLLCMFDTLIAIRVMLGIDKIIQLLQLTPMKPLLIMPTIGWIQIVILLSGCLFGMFFIIETIGGKDMLSKRFSNGIVIATITLFASLAAFPMIMQSDWYYLVMIGFLIANLLLIIKMILYAKRKVSIGLIAIIMHNIYIQTVVCMDLWQLGPHLASFKIIGYLYIISFFFHLIMRQQSFNKGYNALSLLNDDLESIVEERTAQLVIANSQLIDIAEKDSLTGAYNRLSIDKKIEDAINEQGRSPFPLYLCFIDLDHFKKINDHFGHDAGDEMLVRLSEIVRKRLSANMIFARIGGEEFVLVMKNITSQEAFNMVETIRFDLEKEAKENEKATTASFGLVQYKHGKSAKDLFKAADGKLYEAKHSGRNRIVADTL